MAASASAIETSAKQFVVLLLQGGGALGAYQVGSYMALQDAGYEPDWVAGVSIGSINASILVGNPPAQRLEKLGQFWHRITRSDSALGLLSGGMHKAFEIYSGWEAVLWGQPHFFERRILSPFLAPRGTVDATSFYDTSPLRQTLADLVDFNLINAGKIRLSLGATHVETGELQFFQNFDTPKNHKVVMTTEHVMASGSLPPGFPGTRINGQLYWDGGCVSNTPLEAVVEDEPRGRSLVFMIDLWTASGPVPGSMYDVLWREKQIRYASRNAHAIRAAAAKLEMRCTKAMLQQAAPGVSGTNQPGPQAGGRMDIVHIVYDSEADHIANSDAEFSRRSIAERQKAGYDDMRHVLQARPWLDSATPPDVGVVVHKVAHGNIETKAGAAAT